MCQLMGMNCNVPTDIAFSFTGFARRGGATSDHVDGWGIAFFEGPGVRHFVDTVPAAESAMAEFVRRYPIKSRTVIAHIRKATQGAVVLENCHPFVRELWGRYWVFAHNGDLKGRLPTLHAGPRPVGSTDSEHAFAWLMQELAKSHASLPKPAELQLTLHELFGQLARRGTCNVLLSNGDVLWAHASTQLSYIERSHPFGRARLQDDDVQIDFAQHTTPADRVAVLATTPLTADEQWTALHPGQVAAFEGGIRLL